MRLRVIMKTVERLRRDQEFRQRVAAAPLTALAGLGLSRDECLATGALSAQFATFTAPRDISW